MGIVISGSWHKSLSTNFFLVNETYHTEITSNVIPMCKIECSLDIFSFKQDPHAKLETPNFPGNSILRKKKKKNLSPV